MCGRYRLSRDEAQRLAEHMGITVAEVYALYDELVEGERWNMPPGSKRPPPIFRRPAAGQPVEVTASITWGIMLGKHHVTCAREDNAKAHRANLAQRRCLIPMGGYYEWFRVTMKKKVPHDISLPGGEPFCVAGIYGPWQSPGKQGQGFAVVTCEPGPDIAWLHDRLPLVVQREHWMDWLRDDLQFDDVRALMNDVLIPQAQALQFHAEPLPLPSGPGSENIPARPPAFTWWIPAMHPVLRTIQQLMIHNNAPASQADVASDSGVEGRELEDCLRTLERQQMICRVDLAGEPGAGWVLVNETAPGHSVAVASALETKARAKGMLNPSASAERGSSQQGELF